MAEGGRGGRGQQEEGMRAKEEQKVWPRDRRRMNQVCVKKWRRRWGSKCVEDLAGFEGTGRQGLGVFRWLAALANGFARWQSSARPGTKMCVSQFVRARIFLSLCVSLAAHLHKKKLFPRKHFTGNTAPSPPTQPMFVHGPHWLCGCLPPCAFHHLPNFFQNLVFTLDNGARPVLSCTMFHICRKLIRNKISGHRISPAKQVWSGIWGAKIMCLHNNMSSTSLIVVWGGQQRLKWGNLGLLGLPRGLSDLGQRAKPTMAVLKYVHGRTLH